MAGNIDIQRAVPSNCTALSFAMCPAIAADVGCYLLLLPLAADRRCDLRCRMFSVPSLTSLSPMSGVVADVGYRYFRWCRL
jgi:hypothetical protein